MSVGCALCSDGCRRVNGTMRSARGDIRTRCLTGISRSFIKKLQWAESYEQRHDTSRQRSPRQFASFLDLSWKTQLVESSIHLVLHRHDSCFPSLATNRADQYQRAPRPYWGDS